MSSSTGGEVGSLISRSFGFSVMLWLKVVLVSSVSMCCLMARVFAASSLPQDEVNVLNQIAKTMGATDWSFKDDACEHYNTIRGSQRDPERSITCVNGLENDTSHVRAIKFKRFSLPGVLPPQLAQLPYIEEIDFAYNYLNGSIPTEWASMQLKFISLFGNRLSGNIPFLLGSITSLTYLDLEANQFSGTVPPELGKLVNLETLRLSSNQLSGNLPTQLAELKNISDLRINDNNFNGSIPDFIQNWKKLNRLEMQASGLEGPIPSSISVLDNLTQLRISDISAVSQPFPALVNMTSLRQMTLKNCSISGEIPTYIWGLNSLKVLDLSFNKLHGKLPNSSIGDHLELILLSNNSLNGNISESILRRGVDLDLSYNNFTQQSSNQPACQRRMNSNVNLFKSSLMENNLNGVLPCMSGFKCPKYWQSFHINCGGDTVHVNGTTYEGDGGQDGGSAKLYVNDDSNWGFSSTGDYKDDGDLSNSRFIYNSPSQNISGLYSTARVSPLSLTYFGYCLENGDYTVTLHFAEIGLTNDDRYSSLGRRLFDIYIQGKLVEKDFNIEAEARGAFKPVTKPVNASVTNNILEIRFIWAGKGTTSIPVGGVHGPLVSAISVDSNSKTHSGGSIKIAPIVGGVVGVCLLCLALGILWWRCYHRPESGRQKDFEGLDIQISSFTLKQIKAATNNFDPVNKIGEGGFGPVFKGQLSDGTVVAVKQLSSKSRQGNREFLNEMGMISCLQHPNLVKLHGCCIEGDQLLLVYEYMENNSLARALYGQQNCQLKLDWPTRHKICIGIARGLAFLHEESRLKIVHRDIKATNVLLDRDLSPKISDFGLAKLDEEGNTHISTRIAGTIGYMAPEYALWGYLTYKADVYSFGVVALEIVSGKHNMSCTPENDCACLLDWACQLQRSGKLMELVDQKLGFQFSKEEAERMIKTALVCTNASASLRPSMSEVVGMLEGTTGIPDLVPEASSYSEDLRFKPIRDHHRQMHSERLRGNKAPHPSSTGSGQGTSSASAHEHHEIKQETNLQVLNVESQISTSVPSWNGSSSNSANNLNCHTV